MGQVNVHEHLHGMLMLWAIGYVDVHVNWGAVGWGWGGVGWGKFNVHVHLHGMLMLWVMLTFMNIIPEYSRV